MFRPLRMGSESRGRSRLAGGREQCTDLRMGIDVRRATGTKRTEQASGWDLGARVEQAAVLRQWRVSAGQSAVLLRIRSNGLHQLRRHGHDLRRSGAHVRELYTGLQLPRVVRKVRRMRWRVQCVEGGELPDRRLVRCRRRVRLRPARAGAVLGGHAIYPAMRRHCIRRRALRELLRALSHRRFVSPMLTGLIAQLW